MGSEVIALLDGRSVVRILDVDGQAMGSGFLVGPTLLATCAHVIAEIAGTDPWGAAPSLSIEVDFPVARPGRGACATVRRWRPLGDDGRGDVALLELADAAPSGVRMPALRRMDRLWGRRFSTFGFPEGQIDGVWSTGVFRARQGVGWCQLQGAVGDSPIGPGFSGAPVWDVEAGAVVGMTVAVAVDGSTTAYIMPIEEVLGLDPDLLPNPYRGLESFSEEHAAFFHGRGSATDRLSGLATDPGLVVVVGPSGSGKSSLMHAGLIPRLRRAGRAVRSLDARDTATVAALNTLKIGEVVLLDQFEEHATDDTRAAKGLLAVAVRTAGTVVATLQPESLGDLSDANLAPILEQRTVLLAPMTRGELRSAVVGPAQSAPGLEFEDGLVDRILDDTGTEPGQLPLLELLLARLWAGRTGGQLTHAGYDEAGGVAGSIRRHADEVVSDLDTDLLRPLLLALVGVDGRGRFVRRPVFRADLPARLKPVVDCLLSARLLVGDADGTVELAHQALVDRWPRLRSWLSEDREFVAWRAKVEAARMRWETERRDDGGLLAGTALDAAREWSRRHGPDVPPSVAEYIARSLDRQRRGALRWRVAAAVVTTLALLATTMGVVAVLRGDRLATQLATANAETLGRLASARSQDDPDTATQLALFAYRSDPDDPSSRAALAARYAALRSVVRRVGGAGVTATSWSLSRDHRTAVFTSDAAPGLIVVHDPFGPDPSRWVPSGLPGRFHPTMSSDGRWLAMADPAGTVLLWDLTEHRGPVTLREGGPSVASPTTGLGPAFSPDGTRLAFVPIGGPEVPRRLMTWSLPALAPLPPSVALDRLDGADTLDLSDDPDVFVVGRSGGGPPNGLDVRSAAGTVLRHLPPATLLAGDREIECSTTPPGAGLVSPSVTAVARTIPTGVEVGRYPMSSTGLLTSCDGDGWSSSPPSVSADGADLLERVGTDWSSEPQDVRATSLDDGQVHRFVLPPAPRRPGDDSGRSWALVPALVNDTAVPTAEPSARGTIAAVPDAGDVDLMESPPAGPTAVVGVDPVALTVGGGRTLLVDGVGGSATIDRGSGRVVAVARPVGATAAPDLERDDALWQFPLVDGHPTVQKLSLPDLRPILRIAIPVPADQHSSDSLSVALDGAHLVVLVGAELSVWDRTTGASVHPPTQLGTTPEDVDRYRMALLRDRPGHPDQVVLITAHSHAEVWDAESARLVRGLDLGLPHVTSVAFDPAGQVLYAEDAVTVSAVDAETGRPMRPPFSAQGVSDLQGITRDGRLVGLYDPPGGGGPQLGLWDVRHGILDGTLPSRSPTGPDAVDEAGARYAAPEGTETVALDAGVWARHLCALADRPSTPTELALLPPGVDPSPPCRS